MQSTWTQIELALQTSPQILASLRGPAAAKAIDKASEELGFPFPDALVASLRIHDGQVSDEWPLFKRWTLLSLDQIVDTSIELREFVETPLIALTSNGAGDYQCIQARALDDENPSPVLQWNHESRQLTPLAPDFESWIADVVDGLRISSVVTTEPDEEPPSVPAMDDLIGLVGLSIEQPVALAILANRHVEGDDDPDVGPALINKADGFEVQLGRKGRIEVIQIYTQAKDGFSSYAGILTAGLTSRDGCEAVRAQVGAPTRTGVRNGKLGGWDRFDLQQVCIRFGYRNDEPGIWLITLMAPDIAP